MTSISDLKERARREQERKRRENVRTSAMQESFRNDGFFESTGYTDWDSGSDSSSCGSDSGSGCD